MKNTAFLFLVLLFALPALTEPLTIVAFSDINGRIGSLSYSQNVLRGMEVIREKKPDLVIGAGDYIGGEDIRRRLPIGEFPKMWENFRRNILEPFHSVGIPFAPSPGNHDASGYSRLRREREQYANFWSSRKPAVNIVDDTHFPYFYSYKVKDVFFISMDDVTPFQLNQRSIQLPWIERQLKSAEAQSARARVIYGHVPIYPVLNKSRHSRGNRGKYFEVLSNEQLAENPAGLEAILIQNNVNLAIFAHSHAYFAGKAQHEVNGETKELRILSMPCMSSSPRYLAHTESRSKSGFAVIKIDGNEIDYDVYRYNNTRVEKSTLPEEIRIPKVRYLRDD